MALQPAVLRAELTRIFSVSSGSPAEAAAKLAAAYGRYAQTATAGVVPWVPTGLEERRLRGVLVVSLGPTGSAPVVARAWAQGVTAFWFAPPVVFGVGAVTAVPGAALLLPTLTALFLSPRNSVVSAAASLASALDAATRTVLVTLPPAGPVPLV